MKSALNNWSLRVYMSLVPSRSTDLLINSASQLVPSGCAIISSADLSRLHKYTLERWLRCSIPFPPRSCHYVWLLHQRSDQMLSSFPDPEPMTSHPLKIWSWNNNQERGSSGHVCRFACSRVLLLIKARVSLRSLCGLRVIYIAGGRRRRAPTSCVGEVTRLKHVGRWVWSGKTVSPWLHSGFNYWPFMS